MSIQGESYIMANSSKLQPKAGPKAGPETRAGAGAGNEAARAKNKGGTITVSPVT